MVNVLRFELRANIWPKSPYGVEDRPSLLNFNIKHKNIKQNPTKSQNKNLSSKLREMINCQTQKGQQRNMYRLLPSEHS